VGDVFITTLLRPISNDMIYNPLRCPVKRTLAGLL
jgi:hypothetical protein